MAKKKKKLISVKAGMEATAKSVVGSVDPVTGMGNWISTIHPLPQLRSLQKKLKRSKQKR